MGTDTTSFRDDSDIVFAREAAAKGLRPHDIVASIRDRMDERFGGKRSIIAIEACVMRAFSIPLREVRDIERWVGLFARGAWGDLELDNHLEPWIVNWSHDLPTAAP